MNRNGENEQTVNSSLKIVDSVEECGKILYNAIEIVKKLGDELEMVSKKLVVRSEEGLHIHSAKLLAQTAENCDSKIVILHKHNVVNAKSMLNILSAAIKAGDEIELRCTGPNEEVDMKKMEEVLQHL